MKSTRIRPGLPALVGALLLATGMARGQEPAAGGDSAADLAKKLSNPIAALVSVPFQFNWEQGVGPNDGTRFILNVQPVMPFTLTKNVNLIARVIVPLVSQPVLVAGGAPTFGVSDVLSSFFLSPSKPSKVIWGVGPVVNFPSTSEPTLGSGKWNVGPTFLALTQAGGWTVGGLVNQLWSVGGDVTRKDVSQMFLQPFVSYTTKNLWTIGVNSEMTANWKAPTDNGPCP